LPTGRGPIPVAPKYVVSRTLGDRAWNATVLGDDPATEIARLKEEPGKNLVKYGTSRLDDLLLREQLVDQLHLLYFPVLVGTGQRLFEDVDTSSFALELTNLRRIGNGSVMLSLAVHPAGS
jgi:dihydrofolate reductase